MAKCRVCEYCGACLDFGERCDCAQCMRPGGCRAGCRQVKFGKGLLNRGTKERDTQ